MDHDITLHPIGWVESVFKEKFGAPRQSGVVPSATGVIHFYPPYDQPDAFAELEGFSHLWVVSQFHLVPDDGGFRPKVRPPKLGGSKKVGVFASRAPFRPNRLCLSVVKLEEVEIEKSAVSLRVSGLDMVDGTPVLDIKPYLPYADARPEAVTAYGLAHNPELIVIPERPEVYDGLSAEDLLLIEQTLRAQPQPAYSAADHQFGVTLAGWNVVWKTQEDRIVITEIKKKN